VNARSPYLASGLGHVLALAGLLSLSALQRPPALIPGVRIVSLGGAPRGGGGGKTVARSPAPPAAPVPPAEKPAAAVKPSPKAVQTAPPRERAKAASPHGALPAQKQEVVSKTAPKSPGKAADKPAPAVAVPAASTSGAAGRPGTASGTGSGSGPADGRGGVGIEADGEPGLAAGYLSLLRDKVAANWQPPPSIGRLGEARAVVYFVVSRAGGQPGNLTVQAPSGVSFFDRAALSAIQGAAPLPPLPGVWPYESIAIKFTFYQQY
jgi:periplasmic protein TonB